MAETNRTSTTASACSEPTRRTTPSWMTRSSFAWMDIGISVSSSRKSVPPLAVSRRPGLSRSAPVKAPFRWPNISLSRSGSGRAAALIGTSERLARRLWWWMNWAMSSLPVPLSPLMSTEASVPATLRASSTALRNAGETPIIANLSPTPVCCISWARRSWVSRDTMTACDARPIRTCRWVAENGLGR